MEKNKEQTMTNEIIGVHADMSNEQYHSHSGSYSRSALMKYNKSPKHFWAEYINPDKPDSERTDAMIFGEAFHQKILEPDLFDKNFAKKPERVLLKESGKEAYDEYKKKIKALEVSDKHFLSDVQSNMLDEMKHSIMSNEICNMMIEGAGYEKSYFWEDQDTGLILKCRPDILQEQFIVDIKTCADASHRTMQNDMKKYGYHIQAAMMIDGLLIVESKKIKSFYLLAIEKKYPFCHAIYEIDDIAIECGRRKYKKILFDLKNSLEKDEWPSYETQSLSLPAWAIED